MKEIIINQHYCQLKPKLYLCIVSFLSCYKILAYKKVMLKAID